MITVAVHDKQIDKNIGKVREHFDDDERRIFVAAVDGDMHLPVATTKGRVKKCLHQEY